MEFILQHVHRVHVRDCNYRLRNLIILDACYYLSFSFTDLHLIDLKRDDFISQEGSMYTCYRYIQMYHTKNQANVGTGYRSYHGSVMVFSAQTRLPGRSASNGGPFGAAVFR